MRLQTRAKPSEENTQKVSSLRSALASAVLVRSSVWVCVAVKRPTTLQVLRHVGDDGLSHCKPTLSR